MQKLIIFTLCFVLPCCLCLALPLSIQDSQSQQDDCQKDVKHQHQTIHEVIHVHNVPMQIPLYASIVVHDSKQPQYLYQPHPPHPQGSIIQSVHKDSVTNDCSAAPNGAGFRQLFQQAYALMPRQRIAKIISNTLKYDVELRNFFQLLHSKDTLKQLTAIANSAEFEALAEYACRRLYMSLRDFFKIGSSLLAVPVQDVESSMSDDESEEDLKRQTGVSGLLKHIYDILPREQLRALYQRLKTTDPNVAISVQELKAPEFRRLVEKLHQLPAYKKIRQTLMDAGLPIADYNKLLANALGWEEEEVFKIFHV